MHKTVLAILENLYGSTPGFHLGGSMFLGKETIYVCLEQQIKFAVFLLEKKCTVSLFSFVLTAPIKTALVKQIYNKFIPSRIP